MFATIRGRGYEVIEFIPINKQIADAPFFLIATFSQLGRIGR